jgi:hypothetical protein
VSDLPEKISWQADEYHYREKGRDWFIVVGIIAAALAVASILFDNILFAILILVAASTLIIQSIKKPRRVTFELNKRGILIEEKFYPYNTIESFGIDEEPTPKLLAKSKKLVMPLIALPIGHEQVESVRAFLKPLLAEEELEEPLLHKLIEHFGF